MTSLKLNIPAAVLALGFLCTHAHAQDYLGSHLDTMREHTLRQHQQRMSTPNHDESEPARESCLTVLTPNERVGALRRHRKEFKKIEEREGMKAAYCWLKAQVDAGR